MGNHCITVTCAKCGAGRCVRGKCCDSAPDEQIAKLVQEVIESGKAVKADQVDCDYCLENEMYYD